MRPRRRSETFERQAHFSPVFVENLRAKRIRDDEHAIQDGSGNDAASFTETAINNSTVAPVPALPLAGVALLGLLLACLGNWLRQTGREAR